MQAFISKEGEKMSQIARLISELNQSKNWSKYSEDKLKIRANQKDNTK